MVEDTSVESSLFMSFHYIVDQSCKTLGLDRCPGSCSADELARRTSGAKMGAPSDLRNLQDIYKNNFVISACHKLKASRHYTSFWCQAVFH